MSIKQIAGYAGVVFAVAFPFVDFNFLYDRLRASSDVFNLVAKIGMVAVLALVAFGVQKRHLSFFGIRGFGWRDLGAMLVAMFWAVALIFVNLQLLQRFSAPGTLEANNEAEGTPLAVGLALAVVAGISEEFIYRGFVSEELGELLQDRWLAGGFSVVAFALAHVNTRRLRLVP